MLKRFLIALLIGGCGGDSVLNGGFIDEAEAITLTDSYVYPQQAHLLIDVPLNGTIAVRKGPQPTSFGRGSTRSYYSGRLKTKPIGLPVTNANIQGAQDSASGYEAWGVRRNLITFSEDLDNEIAWQAVGTMAVSQAASVPDPANETNTFLLNGSASGDLVKHDVGVTAASTTMLCAAYVRSVSGTTNVTVRIRDSGNTEQGVVTVAATTSWERSPTVYHVFSSSASGNAIFEIETGSGDAYATKAQCHRPDATYRTGSINEIGPYIKTTNVDVSTNSDDLRFDGTTVDSARTAGSLCFWVKIASDLNVVIDGFARNLFSQNGEQFSLQTNARGGNPLSMFVGGVAFQATSGPDNGQWSHICASWKTSPHSYKIYKNGVQIASSTDALGPWTAAAAPLYLGKRSDSDPGVVANSIFRNFAFWDTVLTPTEITTIYTDQAPTFAVTYSTGKLFEMDLGTALYPTTCTSCGYQYISSFATPYWSDATTYRVSTAGVPTIGYPYNNSSRTGIQFVPNNRNYILRSEDPAHAAWTAVASPTVTSNVGRYFGSAPDGIAYGTIAGVSGDGIKQSVTTNPYPIADSSWIASAYVSTASGTLAGIIKIRATGGSPEELTTAFTATTTPTRVFLRRAFSAAATTGVEMEFGLTATGTLRIGGLMLERRAASFNDDQNDWGPMLYLKTTTAGVSSTENCLEYDMAGNVNLAKGTSIMWLAFENPSTLQKDSDGEGIWSFISTRGNFGAAGVSNRISQYYGGTTVNTPSLTYSGNTWIQLGFTWNQATGAFKIYQDGTQVASTTSAGLATPQLTQMEIGCGGPAHRGDDAFKGVAGRYAIWGTDDVSLITTDWSTYKASYGR